MRRTPLTPFLAVAVAMMSSTGHGHPNAGVTVDVQSGLDQVRDNLLAGLDRLLGREVVTPAGYLGDLLGAAGDNGALHPSQTRANSRS